MRLAAARLCAWALLALATALPGRAVAQDAAPACPPPVLPAAAPEPARDRGPLWQLQRDGRTSYLYGTVHVGRPAWGAPGPKLQAALRASRVLALELDVQDPALPAQLQAAAAEQAAALQALPPALQQRLAQAADRACLPSGSLAGLPPLMQAAALSVLDARWLGLDAAYGLDVRLATLARQRGLPVASLETPAVQARALQAETPDTLAPLLEVALRQIEDGSARRVTERLVRAWEAGDLDTLERFEEWCECAPTQLDRDFWRRLNDERNPALADGILALHRQGSVLAAVGALHMTGPAALPQLLQARGFRVQRLDRPAAAQTPPR